MSVTMAKQAISNDVKYNENMAAANLKAMTLLAMERNEG